MTTEFIGAPATESSQNLAMLGEKEHRVGHIAGVDVMAAARLI